MFENTLPCNLNYRTDIASNPSDLSNNADQENSEKENTEIKFNLDFGDLGDFFYEGNSVFNFSEELGISNATK